MARVRKIQRRPVSGKNYYLVDANVLVNKHLPASLAPTPAEADRIKACRAWWQEIDDQLKAGCARVFIPDVCIAEAFKALADKHYRLHWFARHADYAAARNRLSRDIRTTTKTLKRFDRIVRYHDLSTNRDIIIGVDRFFELFFKHRKRVQISDLILVATAKYLLEFFDIPKDRLHLVTSDTALREGISKAVELPNAYDPTLRGHRAAVVFE